MKNPVVSIITPVYNTGSILMETVESVLQQKPYNDTPVPEFEMIVIDDHSDNKETISLLAKLPSIDHRIKVVTNRKTKGVSGARNTGIEQSNAEWIAFLDSDDLLLPESLAYRWNFITKNPEANWVVTPFYLLKNNQIEKNLFKDNFPYLYSIIHNSYDLGKESILEKPVEHLCNNLIIGVATSLIKKIKIQEHNGFDETLTRHEDFELWCKLATKENLYFLYNFTSIYRIRPGSLTHGEHPTFFGEEKVLKKLIQNPLFESYISALEERLFKLYTKYCYYYREKGLFKEQLKWSTVFIKDFPLSLRPWLMLFASLIRK